MKPIAKGAAFVLPTMLAATLFFTPLYASSGESQSSPPESSTTAESGSNAQNDDITDFYVSARIPENQTDTNLSYFNLLMQPDQEQVLEVEVVNEGTTDISVDVSATTAFTNPNGIIEYKARDMQDETLNHPFSELAEVLETSIQVPAGGTTVASVRITMPPQEFDGVILGGLVFTKQAPEMDMDQAENGAMIQNVYNYVVGVVLQENDNASPPDFELLNVDANLFDNQPSFIHAIRNREPAVVKSMDVTASVYRGDDVQGTPVATRTQELVDMAPNSVLEFAAQPDDGTLEAGTYTSEVVLQLDGEEWRFTNSFMVQADEATLVNDLAPFTPAPAQKTNTVLIVLLVVLVLAVIVLAIALVARRGKTRRNTKR